MARRMKSLHHNLQEGHNVSFHREHRSKKGRSKSYGSRKRRAHYRAERQSRLEKGSMKQRIQLFVRNNRFDDNITA